jgi:GrpB-like predicted nucleotidyltransferase (UPF0157 family)
MAGNALPEEPPLTAHGGASIGLRRGLVRLVPYNPAWVRLCEVEAATVGAALGNHALRIEHVGSTAVAGMTAKPILDIVGIPRRSDGPDLVATLVDIGYEHNRPESERDYRVTWPVCCRRRSTVRRT